RLHASSLSSFHWYDDHGNLPSFPTRRSSDLREQERSHAVLYQGSFARADRIPHVRHAALHAPEFHLSHERQRCNCRICRWRSFRSEEHTSELQSRENLVCRLLLEQKNKKQVF